MPKTTTHTTNYPFGSTQPNPNNLNANQYRYGFGGMEQDKQSSSYTTYFRQYDPRIARWKSTDPVTQPWQSPYTAFDNNPILYVDPMGDVSWCGIGTVFSGLASFAGNMALRALPTLGLNIALNNFLPNATHTGNNSGRFLGADGGTTNINIIPEEVRNKGGYWLDEFEVVDNAPKKFWDGMVDGGNDLRSSIDYYLKALADGKWDIVWNFIYSTSFGSMGNQKVFPDSESEFTTPSNSYEWGQAVFNSLPIIIGKGNVSRFGQIRGGILKAQELNKRSHNLKLLDGKRIDLKGRHPLSKGHYNKVTKEQLEYPHVYDPAHPGGVRAPNANDYIEIFNLYK
ncbi:MAG: hypothetical protein HND27_10810 [Bacteroidetes bacterium]|nr:hypothetical protein [Bacteroidota bacterium]NOG96252.1 hypothetical protein [Bacteroidota bacterium]GIK68932.1 MAG: hypothetical protein BroJett020_02270 [Bacteroidota bacterium]